MRYQLYHILDPEDLSITVSTKVVGVHSENMHIGIKKNIKVFKL